MNNLTQEMIQKAKATKSIEELKALAKENGLELADEEAVDYYEQLHITTGELEDDELDNVAGGGCHKKDGRLIVTMFNSCDKWACYICGSSERNLGDAHGCGYIRNGKYSMYRRIQCNYCKHSSREKGMLLCNHPDNRE